MSNPVEGAKKVARFVAIAAKFFASLIGQVVFFLILVLLVGLLAYIIFMVIAKDLGKLLGIEAAGARMDEQNYEIQLRLANSGYDSMLNADELVSYYGFEYAVLMDAVKFFEETGVATIETINISPVDCNTIDREQWAWLNAARFQTGRDSDNLLVGQTGTDNEALINAGFLNEDGTRTDGGVTIVGYANGADDLGTAGDEFIFIGGNSIDGEINPADVIQFSKPSSGKIVYEGVKNEYTNEKVLVPYLKVTRKWLDYNYFIRDKTWEGVGSPLNVSGKGKMDRYNLDGGYDSGGASFSDGFEYIYNNIFVYSIKNELNAGNKSAYPQGRYTSSYIQEAMEGTSKNDDTLGSEGSEGTSRQSREQEAISQSNAQNTTVGVGQTSASTQTTGNETAAVESTTSAEKGVDLYKEYENSLWYTVGDKGTRTYKIPFRALLDRFLPNANLMASWRHLTDETDTSGSIDIVNEIQQIYSKACLEGESGGGEPAEMSNTRTFAYMGEAKVESNLFRHWKAIQEERYVFMDAFEGIAFGNKGDEIDGEVTFSWIEFKEVYNTKTGKKELEKDPKSETFVLQDILKGKFLQSTTNADGEEVPGEISYAEAATLILDKYIPQESRDEGGLGDWFVTDTVLIPYPTEGEHFVEDTTGKTLTLTNPGEEYIDRTGEILCAGELAVTRENTGSNSSREYDTTLPTNGDPAANEEVKATDFNIITLKDLEGIDSQDTEVELNTTLLAALIHDKVSGEWTNKNSFEVTVDLQQPSFYAVFPVDKKEIAYTQSVWAKSMPFYLTLEATTWSSVKRFAHRILEAGTFDNPENYHYVIQCNNFAKGYMDYKCKMQADWRCELFAPVIAGDENEAKTKARESDVLVILSEWEEAAEEGIGAADYFIRDLRSLIEYSKGVKDGRDGGTTSPVSDSIHEDSYTYLYIKDEILEFDEALAEPIFWSNRLFATIGDDEIDEETENKMKSRMVTKTWQNVDYALYDECKNEGRWIILCICIVAVWSAVFWVIICNGSEFMRKRKSKNI